VTAQDSLRLALKDVLGPNARVHGFKGSAPTWRKSNSHGDWVVVQVQSSSYSSAERLRCVVNLSAIPEPWLRWQRELLAGGMPKAISESLGLYRDRLHPSAGAKLGEAWWEIDDSIGADSAVSEIVMQLEMVGWPLLDDWLTRDGLKRRVDEGDFGFSKANLPLRVAMAQALLLMDGGPSPELRAILEECRRHAGEQYMRMVQKFEAWVNAQAEQSPNWID
jgi:hypothetical protein